MSDLLKKYERQQGELKPITTWDALVLEKGMNMERECIWKKWRELYEFPGDTDVNRCLKIEIFNNWFRVRRME